MNALRNWWRNHKTKTLGYTLAALSAAQAYLPQIQQLLREHFGPVMFAIGVAVAILGHLNSQQNGE